MITWSGSRLIYCLSDSMVTSTPTRTRTRNSCLLHYTIIKLQKRRGEISNYHQINQGDISRDLPDDCSQQNHDYTQRKTRTASLVNVLHSPNVASDSRIAAVHSIAQIVQQSLVNIQLRVNVVAVRHTHTNDSSPLL